MNKSDREIFMESLAIWDRPEDEKKVALLLDDSEIEQFLEHCSEKVFLEHHDQQSRLAC